MLRKSHTVIFLENHEMGFGLSSPFHVVDTTHCVCLMKSQLSKLY